MDLREQLASVLSSSYDSVMVARIVKVIMPFVTDYVAEKDATIAGLKAANDAHDEYRQHMQGRLAEKDAQIKQLQGVISQLGDALWLEQQNKK